MENKQKNIPAILLLFFSLFLIGCVEGDMAGGEENTPIRMTWSYYDYPKLEFSINKYYNPLRLDEVEGIIIPHGATTYTSSTDLYMSPCRAGSKHIDFCFNALNLKARGFTGRMFDVYLFMGIQWNIGSANQKSIKDLRTSTEALAVYSYTLFIPQVDDEGFPLSIKDVDIYWCGAESGKYEYGEDKPVCQEVIDKIKKEREEKKAEQEKNEFASNCRRNCWADPLSCTEECCPAFMEIVDEENQKTAYERTFLHRFYDIYKQTGKILNCDEDSLNEFLALMKRAEGE